MKCDVYVDKLTGKETTRFIDAHGNNEWALIDYRVSEDLLKPLEECYSAWATHYCPYKIRSENRFITVDRPIDDFLRYVIEFNNVAPYKKWYVIYALLSMPNTSDYIFDVHNNTIVSDLLLHSLNPPSSAVDHGFETDKFNPIVENLWINFFYLRINKTYNWFNGTLDDYNKRLAFFNFVHYDVRTLKDGAEVSFNNEVSYRTTMKSGYLYTNDIPFFIELFDGDDENIQDVWEVSYRLKLSQLQTALDLFCVDKPGQDIHKKMNAKLFSWILDNFDASSEEVAKRDILAGVDELHKHKMTSVDPFTKILARSWLAYLRQHISEKRFMEVLDCESLVKFAISGINIEWLIKIDQDSQYDDDPLSLLIPIFADVLD